MFDNNCHGGCEWGDWVILVSKVAFSFKFYELAHDGLVIPCLFRYINNQYLDFITCCIYNHQCVIAV